MRKFVFLPAVILLTVTAVFSQQTPDEEDIVKITSKLVQMDVVVTDANGNQVTDLTAADFQIFEDGKQRKITGFAYVPFNSRSSQTQTADGKKDQKAILPPSSRRPSRLGRVIAFIVDDGNCKASLVGMKATRDALEKFITEQMQPDDVVAIYQTRSGSSMFQQYTSDKTQLLRAARKIRWLPPGGGCTFSDGSFFEAAKPNNEAIGTIQGLQNIAIESTEEKTRRELSEDFYRDRQIVGSLGVLRYAIRGLEKIPGRKVLFFMSDGVPLIARDGRVLPASDILRDLTDLANRSAVVINTVDSRGLFYAEGIDAQDDVLTIADFNATAQISASRRREANSTQDGLAFLSGETGGRFYKGENYLHVPLARALAREKGYYLVAYEPDDDSFQGKNFNTIDVRVTRQGLRVSSRAGFLGVVDQKENRAAKTGDSALYEAIVQPLPGAGMNLALTAFFGNTPAGGSFLRTLVHIAGSDITFTDEPGGMRKAAVDVVAVTLNEKNEVVDEFTHAHTFKVPAAALPLIERNGVMYSADVKVKKPGFYNFRVAMRDVGSGKLGTAGQVVQVPDFKPGKLYLSGLVVTEVNAAGKFAAPDIVDQANAFALPASGGVPGIRIFRRGSVIAYPYYVYNARVAQGGKPSLTVEVNLYHDGKLLLDGPPLPAELQPQKDLARISDFGYLRLNPNLAAGDYVLQVIVRDLVGGKNAVSSQYSDFQIVD